MSYVSRLSLLGLVVGSYASADTIAVVDLFKVVRSLPNLEQIQEDMQKEATVAQGKLNNKKLQLDAKVQEFEANKETLSDQKADKMRREITTLQRELKALESELREDLAIHEQEQKNMLINEASDAIAAYAQKNKIDVVITTDSVVYRAESKDISDMVIKSLAAPASAPEAAPVKASPVSDTKSSRRSK
ncbi:MAG: OmpH family outer membrane protein [Gammaproteobacteria bacterium]|nr:OmpH family outer membrane protein [Gammaproteobacteria bacterium]